MGYSVAVPLKTIKARVQMVSFLRSHLRPWSEVTKGTEVATHPEFDSTSILRVDRELSYDRGKLKIGFDCHTTTEWIFGYLQWVALRAGRKRRFPEFDITVPVPYVVYDGHELEPVLNAEEWHRCPEKARNCLTDRHGFRRAPRVWEHFQKRTIDKEYKAYIAEEEPLLALQDKLLHAELERLTQVWEKGSHRGTR